MFLTFDVMGDLAFGKPFGMLETEGLNGSDMFIKTMHGFSRVVGSVSNVPWFMLLLQWLPGLSGEFGNFERWCGHMVEKRKQFTPEKPDIFHFLLEAEPQNVGEHHIDLIAEAQLASVAGSDTTANTFINIFTQLANNPHTLQKLQHEIDAIYNAQYGTDKGSDDKGSDVPEVILNGNSAATRYLDAVINEGLRLNPAVPSGAQRVTTEGGVTINELTALLPQNPDERSFPEPHKFMPERWYELDKEIIMKQKTAFIPFSVGAFGCVGKSLALLELRMVTAKILHKFNVSSAEGNSVEKLYNNSFDGFTLLIGDIEVVFTPR
ncbi:uncharacterized protein H6S33_000191 [Morchella sextelata]|uniref:uncharacterized protein n=1 Tax=Morchella sextelata TaxID=1174677 RepID=UPI001D05820C|nr:uncharacterized protein H6S33_000191 [Morchella sextelata]KAH0614555.1 hypothetical protein H6S33_000191 [Morchella sextelata]